MQPGTLVRWSNRLSLITLFLLIYWIFIFIISAVFEFKVVRENLTEAFGFSILGLLALLLGSMIMNIMLNLTRIAGAVEKQSSIRSSDTKRPRKVLLALFLFSFPLLFGLLYWGDVRSSAIREKKLINAAETLIDQREELINGLANYRFDSTYVHQSTSTLRLLSQLDENFPSIAVLIPDTVQRQPVILRFGQRGHWRKTSRKIDYIFATSTMERSYLDSALEGKDKKPLFSASDGSYELYYPVHLDSGPMILYLTDHRRYGKLGS